MRLINCRTFELEEFLDSSIPRYAILSHRWGSEEITFQEMQMRRRPKSTIQKQGYIKVHMACKQALSDGLLYLWADTCCINKNSQPELAGALVCMFRWYRAAVICYAHLSDVLVTSRKTTKTFEQSSWFARGWTLQELIAPKRMIFFDKSWNVLGDKLSLEDRIIATTSIDREILRGGDVTRRSVAQRMSWAAKRQTTKIEDMAYCLLGLFNISMEIQYGEGDRAFIRLQEHIIQKSRDQSIFALSLPLDNRLCRSLFATSPAAFANCEAIIVTKPLITPKPYFLTNIGLAIQMPIIPWAPRVYLGVLECGYDREHSSIGIFLEQLKQPNCFCRRAFEGQIMCRISHERIRETWNDPLVSKLRNQTIYIEEGSLHHAEDQVFGFKLGGCTAFNSVDLVSTTLLIYTQGYPETESARRNLVLLGQLLSLFSDIRML